MLHLGGANILQDPSADSYSALLYKAWNLRGSNGPLKAAEYFISAASLQPGDANAAYGAMLYCKSLGRNDLAKKYALRLAGGNDPIIGALAGRELAKIRRSIEIGEGDSDSNSWVEVRLAIGADQSFHVVSLNNLQFRNDLEDLLRHNLRKDDVFFERDGREPSAHYVGPPLNVQKYAAEISLRYAEFKQRLKAAEERSQQEEDREVERFTVNQKHLTKLVELQVAKMLQEKIDSIMIRDQASAPQLSEQKPKGITTIQDVEERSPSVIVTSQFTNRPSFFLNRNDSFRVQVAKEKILSEESLQRATLDAVYDAKARELERIGRRGFDLPRLRRNQSDDLVPPWEKK